MTAITTGKTCLRCGHVRTDGLGVPATECPRCGSNYAAFEAEVTAAKQRRLDTTAKQHRPKTVTVVSRAGRLKLQHATAILALLVGLIAGYFAGREHIKYEMRQVIVEAAESVRARIAAVVPPTPPLSQPASTPAPTTPPKTTSADKPDVSMPVSLRYKKLAKREYMEFIEFGITIHNTMNRDIIAFECVLDFQDALGKSVMRSNISIRDPIKAGANLLWDGEIRYNQFIGDHRSLAGIETDRLSPVLIVKKVRFADGELKEF